MEIHVHVDSFQIYSMLIVKLWISKYWRPLDGEENESLQTIADGNKSCTSD